MRWLTPLGRALVLVLLLVGLTSGAPVAQAASPDVLITEGPGGEYKHCGR